MTEKTSTFIIPEGDEARFRAINAHKETLEALVADNLASLKHAQELVVRVNHWQALFQTVLSLRFLEKGVEQYVALSTGADRLLFATDFLDQCQNVQAILAEVPEAFDQFFGKLSNQELLALTDAFTDKTVSELLGFCQCLSLDPDGVPHLDDDEQTAMVTFVNSLASMIGAVKTSFEHAAKIDVTAPVLLDPDKIPPVYHQFLAKERSKGFVLPELSSLARFFQPEVLQSTYEIESYPGIFKRINVQLKATEQHLMLDVQKLLAFGKAFGKKRKTPLFQDPSEWKKFFSLLKGFFENAGMQLLLRLSIERYHDKVVSSLSADKNLVKTDVLEHNDIREFLSEFLTKHLSLDFVFNEVRDELKHHVFENLPKERLTQLATLFHSREIIEVLVLSENVAFNPEDYLPESLGDQEEKVVQFFSSFAKILKTIVETLDEVLSVSHKASFPGKEIEEGLQSFLHDNAFEVPTFEVLATIFLGEDQNIGTSGRLSGPLDKLIIEREDSFPPSGRASASWREAFQSPEEKTFLSRKLSEPLTFLKKMLPRSKTTENFNVYPVNRMHAKSLDSLTTKKPIPKSKSFDQLT